MKKIIAITAMAAAAAAFTFADEPVADLKVAELSGNASVTWGVDLDTGKTGFKNAGESTFKVNIANKGSKSTSGEGIWAEIGVEATQNVGFKSHSGTTDESGVGGWDGDNGGKVKVSAAKLHFGPVYLGITKGDTLYGAYKIPNAIRSADNDNAERTGDVAGTSHTQGIVAGYSSDLFDVAVDFRSNPDGTNYYNNDYGFAGEATLKFVPNLAIGVGADYQINQKAFGLGANASYKISLGEKFYVKPSAAFTMGKIDTANPTMEMAAGVLFGWGDTADANAGVYYLDNDAAKKVTPGVGVAAKITSLTNNPVIHLVPSFYSGDIIPNLTAAALGEINVPTASGSTIGFGVAAGLKYALAINDSVKITPQVGMRFAKGATLPNFTAAYANPDNGGKTDIVGTNTDGTLMNVKVGADVSGLINNTTFSVDWTSRNLLSNSQDAGRVGTINVTCKIAL